MGRRALYLFAPPVRMKSVVFLCYSYGLLALLDFLGTLLFLYNISRDSAPYEACFHTYFGIYWIFTASSKIVQQMHVKTALFLGLFSDILSKVQLFVLRCAKSRLFGSQPAPQIGLFLRIRKKSNFCLIRRQQKNDDCNNHRLCVGNSGCAYAGEFKCRNVPCASRTGFSHFGGL